MRHDVQTYQSALVVDDDPFSVEVATIALHRLGLSKIVTADDGHTGLRAYDRMRPLPDLIICDVFMPDVDGIEFIQGLGQRRFAGALVLASGGDLSMLQMATQLARKAHGLRVLGAFPKPLLADTLAVALGLPPPAQEAVVQSLAG